MGIEEQVSDRPKTYGVIAGSFDLLHTGHILALAAAKDNCDHLTVLLQTDPTIDRPEKNKPIQSTFERYIQIQAVEYIDWLIPFDTEEDLINMIKMISPDIRFVGEEYKGTKHTGYDIPDVKIFYNRRRHEYSSTQLRTRLIPPFNK